MKFVLPLAAIFFLSTVAPASSETIANNPAASQADGICWAIQTTNDWPEKLWVYKVMPQQFSNISISNLMLIGSFSAKDRTKSVYVPENKDAVRFGASALKYLEIVPSLGYIRYHDEAPLGMKEGPVKGVLEPLIEVPDEATTTRLGLQYLRKLGIDSSQIAIKPDTCELDLHWTKGTRGYGFQGKEINETNCYGVFFSRRVDGINVEPLAIRGGVSVSFGNHAKVVDLQLCWRNLEPYELFDCPAPEKIEEWLKDGKLVTRSVVTGGAFKPNADQKTTITKVQFFYNGLPGDEHMDFCFPFASIEAVAEGKSGTNMFWFRCPMTFSKGNWSIIK